jgi:para-nitrobenzyl esterase
MATSLRSTAAGWDGRRHPGAPVMDRRSILTAGAAVMAALWLPPPLWATDRSIVISAPSGRFRGSRLAGVQCFLGIRYGVARRFQPPRAPARAAETINAMKFGPAAPQRAADRATSEDCLYLNIWTPEAHRDARRPVMVYVHGGAYSSGSGSEPRTDGAKLAARGDAVVVTLNHRLNAFGYLYLAQLSEGFDDSGNAGQLDLILALQWVRDNIASFGGDPERVMLFGQSGGGAKIATLMGTADAQGLFHAAATMSGQQLTVSGPQHATLRARAFMDALKIREPPQLLELSTERLTEGLSCSDPVMKGAIYFGPVLDERILTRHPFWPEANPQSNRIPLVLGNTHDEARAFYDPLKAPLVALDWEKLPWVLAPELRVDIDPKLVVARYRQWFPSFAPQDVFFAAVTAARSWRGQIEEVEARARAGAPTWVYQLDFPAPLAPDKRACHTLDIGLVFGTLDAPGSMLGSGAEARAVSDRMMAAFAGLAHGREPMWPRYDLTRRATMLFDVEAHVADDPRREERLLFASVPYIQPGT